MAIYKDRMGNSLSSSQVQTKLQNRLYNYLADFFLYLFSVLNFSPSHRFRRFLLRLSGAKIGKGSAIHMGISFFSARKLTIGEDSIIGRNIFIDGRDNVKIGNHVDIASDVMIYNSEHDVNSVDFKAISGSVEIGDYVFIGPRTIILPGVKIGRGAVVGAGAVVTKDVADFAIAGGVPANVIGERKNKDPNYILGRARLFQ